MTCSCWPSSLPVATGKNAFNPRLHTQSFPTLPSDIFAPRSSHPPSQSSHIALSLTRLYTAKRWGGTLPSHKIKGCLFLLARRRRNVRQTTHQSKAAEEVDEIARAFVSVYVRARQLNHGNMKRTTYPSRCRKSSV